MSAIGEQISRVIRHTHLDVATLAALADLEPERLAAITSGSADARVDEIDRVARVFGVRVRDFLEGGALRAPMRVLLRSTFEEGRSAIGALVETDALRELGEFQRCVLDAAELEGLLGAERRALPTAFYQGDPERAANSLRLRMGLGHGPIPSMRDLLASRGVLVFFTDPDHLDPQIDGASTAWPRPAILVNLVGGGECWWRTRMTLAHELSHLLFDAGEHQTLFSPHVSSSGPTRSTGRWRLFEAFDDIESHADAFAACFLAPRAAVIEAVGLRDPKSEEAIAVVGGRFGVGRTVAINRLQRAFSLSIEERSMMAQREDRLSWPATFERDAVREEVGLRRGVLRELVGRALEAQHIGKVRAREILGVALTERLPLDGLSEELCEPVISGGMRARNAAQQYLAVHHGERDLLADEATFAEGRWTVTVVRGDVGVGKDDRAGVLIVNEDGAVIEDRVIADAREG